MPQPKPTPSPIEVIHLHAERRISEAEEKRLYELAMRGVDAKIQEAAYFR